ncbi:sugar phosphate isomerase [Desulfococcus multivorans]|jgi:sugar phosphate isomerase/epimerase|uniref:Xylose isomerase domain-containing protein TIM barrel n=2 Tax=Desulfococcaceae TaxID=2931039 RepID=S7VFG8_DESML|nr:xylose isormerase domain protein, TIM barrel [Desulfococcus multivorans]AQV00750.1 sugar phosphate isomerase [Desulfococcus multivorans]EPR43218.1 Xylose isomerase domain-containing protein TIM barrel [Desulfococcus multivorans DSM 2059]SJZ40455.1 Sugar phosphate isomerase/epimerase [Desulfococcus multivorans DSM 2059]
MQYGATNFPVKPVLEEIAVFGRLGFDYLELAMDPPLAHHTQVRREQAAVREALDRYGMGIVCHLPTFLSTADLTESLRRVSVEETTASLALAAELGAAKAVLHPSYMNGLSIHVPELWREHALDSLERIVSAGKSFGVQLCLENLFPKISPFSTPEVFGDVFERFPELAMTLDIGHAHIGEDGMPRILEFIKTFADRIHHLHISDNNGRRDEHLPVGQGSLDFNATAEALRRSGYDGTVTLEIFDPDRTTLVESRKALERLFS